MSLIPLALLDRLSKQTGLSHENLNHLFNLEPFKAIRLNPRVKLPTTFLETLPPVDWCSLGYEYGEKVGHHPYYHAGAFYSQEPSAMAVVEMLDVQPDDIILDCAAAPGGKSTHIAGYLGEKGYLFSHEVDYNRAKILSSHIERMGFYRVTVSTGVLKPYFSKVEMFDKVVLDAPCSGEGMMRKDAFAREQWSESLVNACASTQQTLLNQVAPLVKKGGTLLYSTCTFSPEENERNIALFLKNHADFELSQHPFFRFFDEQSTGGIGVRIWPHLVKGEGHYVALLRKKGKETSIVSNRSKSFKKISRESLSHLPFLENLPDGMIEKLGDTYYLVDPNLRVEGLHIMRSGLAVASKHHQFLTPHHHLAHVSGLSLPKVTFNLADEKVHQYLRGESVEYDLPKGWYVFCVDGLPLGWVKSDGKVLKNHYPKGLRLLKGTS